MSTLVTRAQPELNTVSAGRAGRLNRRRRSPNSPSGAALQMIGALVDDELGGCMRLSSRSKPSPDAGKTTDRWREPASATRDVSSQPLVVRVEKPGHTAPASLSPDIIDSE
jgi:hypothetical protein